MQLSCFDFPQIPLIPIWDRKHFFFSESSEQSLSSSESKHHIKIQILRNKEISCSRRQRQGRRKGSLVVTTGYKARLTLSCIYYNNKEREVRDQREGARQAIIPLRSTSSTLTTNKTALTNLPGRK
jgi:hypothetical protein